MKQSFGELTVRTSGSGLTEITRDVEDWLQAHGADEGLFTLFIRHTSASLLIQENADSAVCRDLDRFLAHLVFTDFPFEHSAEGPDDMPAHVKSALTQVSLSIPVTGGHMVLGTWQGVFVFEHRARAHDRHIALQFTGESSR